MLEQFCAVSDSARRQVEENPSSSVVAETLKLLVNSSYGYQIMDQSRHIVTKYLSDEQHYAAIMSKLFKKLEHVNNSWYEGELTKTQIEHRSQSFSGFLFLNTQNCECKSCTTTSLLNFVM